ncbi:MAG: phosphoribosylaminoimidazolesuccinocarboxamide synthase [Desulforhabdus sp.]|jgi:phosphoribosylaminoimidazole-succinocarboxamide synthase|nr:phosphoribosylaminoimidazolesuccinocarboxamide synthase [Desulforhabdus sp.]
MSQTLFETEFPRLKLQSRGKVRDIYDLDDSLLIVATDRISAFDVVMRTPIPDNGKVLTQLSEFWLDFLGDMVEHHLIGTDVNLYPEACKPYSAQLAGRSMRVRKARPLPVECIVRGYLVGSGWKDYQKTGELCGIRLPADMQQAQKLPHAIFTPSTKAALGAHDENISFGEMCSRVGEDIASRVREISINIYTKAASYAEKRGIIVADTKLEFGIVEGRLLLIDEVLTPDSSRFWPADRYKVGGSPESYDKQYLRDYLTESGWKVSDPAPELPPAVVENTRSRYLEALERLSGRKLR